MNPLLLEIVLKVVKSKEIIISLPGGVIPYSPVALVQQPAEITEYKLVNCWLQYMHTYNVSIVW